MSKLEELIARLCPDGVEYKEIKTISKVLRGKRLTKNQLLDNGKYPVYHGGLEPLGFYNESNRSANTVMIINVGASAGTVGFCDTDFWSSDGCFCLEHSISCTDKYLYYFLTTIENTIKSRVRHAGIPTLDAQIIDKIKVPVPPLEVQREIVHILDSYTASNKELKEQLDKELAARQKQYEFYRDALLTFKNIDDTILNERTNELELSGVVRWMRMGDISVVSDYVANGSFATIKENVQYKHEFGYAMLVRTVDFSNGFDKAKAIYIDKHAYNFLKKSKLFGGEIIINNIGAGVGSVFKCPYLDIPMSLAPNAILVNTSNNSFYYYWLKSKHGQKAIEKIVSSSAMPKFNKTGFRDIMVPVPALAEQQRIVDILDRFDALCNDIASGLPAEIEARKKQYEYYRDKLLTFKELKKEA